MPLFTPRLGTALFAAALAACSTNDQQAQTVSTPMDVERLESHIATLASDDFEGRLPGTPGEDKTVDYLVNEFKKLGAEPGNPDGSYVQKVPLVGITGEPTLSLTAGGKDIPMAWRKDYVASTSRFQPEVSIADSPLVFVGYGVQAPEYNWDDYKGEDMHGKTLVMLINDPSVPDAADPSQLDADMFGGSAMTYYGRWTYKYEIGSAMGADAVLIIHETKPAAYGWNVVEHSWSGEAFELANPNGNSDRIPIQGWLTREKAQQLLAASGQDLDALKAQAIRPDFKPVALDATLSGTIKNSVREIESQNVVAKIPGADPELADEYVLYSAHWDHLGKDTSLDGDQIYNGALDNATGTAGLLEIATAFKTAKPASPRSLLFLAVTAEEQGLLGSKFYAENPLYPLTKSLAVINMDALNVWGPTRDVQVIGYGQNSLQDNLKAVVNAEDRIIVPDVAPEKGSYYRSDQFSFAKYGVPGLYAKSGKEIIGKPKGYGAQKRAAYDANDYHGISDEIHDDWDLSGTLTDLMMYYKTGLSVALDPAYPTWSESSEFRRVREESLKSTPNH